MKNKNLKILLIGGSGRMGRALHEVSADMKETSIIDFKDSKKSKFDVAVDFSSPQGCLEALDFCIQKKIPFVSGTTGLSESEFKKIKKASQNIPILWSSNMSLGIVVLKKALQSLSAVADYDFQIEEVHHNKKKDKPSGTALTLQTALTKIVNKKLETPLSIRGGGVFGIHRVFAMGPEETLLFEHQALDRKVFARGALLAAKWLVNQRPGLYSMDDIFDVEK